ncbi:hypothetical protein DR095_01700 [Mycoplasma flocculare]|uniref:Mbov_0395 family pilin-like conjugal transfer protein n=1 Tax=Mesomycoplasma TaxID=2923352 RepID=UPI00136F832A|nr:MULTISPECIES: hypothetical protein [Mesomycoplasma]MXR09983.1 hypothetical protein [Mesomycoplasma hyopneumoniae]MXR56105.1 hypothetical protein [Mesomycoplasma flocculare]
MQNFISLFQQTDPTQKNLEEVQKSVKHVSDSVMAYILIGVSAIVGVIVVAAIIWFIARLLQAKFAGPEQKKVIYRNIKQSAWIFGAIILLLVVGVAVFGAINNLAGTFTNGLQQGIRK